MMHKENKSEDRNTCLTPATHINGFRLSGQSPQSGQTLHTFSSKGFAFTSKALLSDQGNCKSTSGIFNIVRRTRSCARDISKVSSSVSTSASWNENIYNESLITPDMSMQLDHVVAFHQQVSPSLFHPDNFSFSAGSDIPESRSSNISFLTGWPFYSPDLIRPDTSEPTPRADNESLCESENSSFTGGHEAVVLSPPPPESRFTSSNVPSRTSKGSETPVDSDSWIQVPVRRNQRCHKTLHSNEIAPSDSDLTRWNCSSKDVNGKTLQKTGNEDRPLVQDVPATNNKIMTIRNKLRAPINHLQNLKNRLLR